MNQIFSWLVHNEVAIRLFATLIALLGAFLGFWRYYEQKRQQVQSEETARQSEEEARKRSMTERWREAVAYSIFRAAHSDADTVEYLTVTEFYGRMKQAGWDAQIDQSSLGELDLDLLLLSMVEKRLIEPLSGDTFMIRIDSQNVEGRGYFMFAKHPARKILDIIRRQSDELTESDLLEELNRTENIDYSYRPLQFRNLIRDLLDAGLVRFGANGRLQLVHQEEWAASYTASRPEEVDHRRRASTPAARGQTS